ncbi:MAG: SH3 domain-containing protein [Paenisporosarcina sp.]
MYKFLHHKSFSYMITLILLVSIFNPTTSRATGDEVMTTVSSLHMRSGPGLAYPILSTIKKEERMNIHERQGDWLKVSSGQATGWVASWYTKPIETQKSKVQMVVSKVDKLNVRSQASLESSVLTQLSAGDQATLINDYGNWVEISFNQVQGYVSKEYITILNKKTDSLLSKDSSFANFQVAVDILNVRSKPDLTSKRVSQVKKGERYEILEKQNNWVNIKLSKKESGWVYSFYGTLTNQTELSTIAESKKEANNEVTIVYNGTNLRGQPSTSSEVIYRANAGESFEKIGQTDEWFELQMPDGEKAFVASWVVTTKNNNPKEVNVKEKIKRKKGTLNGLTIVIDPGHGGNDSGTSGVRGTEEKGINLQTSELLSSKLSSAGANVVMTRDSDVYVDLRKRVAIGHQLAADAFISVHYDATDSSSINGFTTYYMHNYQKELAESVHKSLGKKLTLRDRGVQPGNYLVLRENRQQAILIELGFLSNPTEERAVTTEQFREQASLGIYNGVVSYFDNQLN